MCELSDLARWKKWENSAVARSERWESNEVSIWERRRVVNREDTMEFKDKILLHCSSEARCKQRFPAGIS